MNPNHIPDREEEAVIDAAFQQGPIPGPEPEATNPDEQAPPPSPASPLGDYLRELGQEFQDQQDEGKVT
jgi:hypothetical protein